MEPIIKREDFKYRIDYARACFEAGVLPELRECFTKSNPNAPMAPRRRLESEEEK